MATRVIVADKISHTRNNCVPIEEFRAVRTSRSSLFNARSTLLNSSYRCFAVLVTEMNTRTGCRSAIA